jgi:hypothetical protein
LRPTRDTTRDYHGGGTTPTANDLSRAPLTLASVDGGALGLSKSATHLYWAAVNDGVLRLLETPIGGGATRTLATGEAPTTGYSAVLAVHGSEVYWAPTVSGKAVLTKVPLDGSDPTPLFTFDGYAESIVVNDDHAYVIDTGLFDIVRVPK